MPDVQYPDGLACLVHFIENAIDVLALTGFDLTLWVPADDFDGGCLHLASRYSARTNDPLVSPEKCPDSPSRAAPECASISSLPPTHSKRA